ncbi:MAG: hypothetical protein J7L45_03080 [Candidatus Aenigmarchaeota archaeon]|nr:hypothetical protein [Candidatus Aenigmarchaeota archaeon]
MKKIRDILTEYDSDNFNRDLFSLFSDAVKLGGIALPVLYSGDSTGFYLGLGTILVSYSIYNDWKLERMYQVANVGDDDIYRNLPVVRGYRKFIGSI